MAEQHPESCVRSDDRIRRDILVPACLGVALSPTMPSYRLAFYERIGEADGAAPAAAPAQ